jgi:hypothetical protein
VRRAAAFPAQALALILSAAARPDRSVSELNGRTPGKPVDCIDEDAAGPALVFNPTTVLFRESGRRIWRMQPDGACQALRPGVRLTIFNIGRRLCAGDRFNVSPIGSTISSAQCRMGPFTPYDRLS